MIHSIIREALRIPYWITESPMRGEAGIDRDILPHIFRMLRYEVGAEVGVRDGSFSETILKGVPNLKLYCVDPWSPYQEMQSNRKQNRFYSEAKARLAAYNAILLKNTSEEALSIIADDSLDFVYIDGAHDYDHVVQDIFGWYAKLRVGGILAGHDYAPLTRWNFGVIPAVNKFVNDMGIKEWYLTNERFPSYIWVKE